MKRVFALLLILILVFSIVGCGTTAPAQSPSPSLPPTAEPVELTIAAAAVLTESLTEIIANYSAVAPNVKIVSTFGASGALQAQIENGAPIDLYFPGATKQMDELESAGLMVTDSIVKLLQNEIVLIIPAASSLNLKSFEDVVKNDVLSIAIGDVASVTSGQYAQEAYTTLKLWDKVAAKAVYGTDVKQVLSWVSTGNVDCGVVYQTDAVNDSTVKIIASAPSNSHKAAVCPVGIVNASIRHDAANEFIKYLQSEEAMNVFIKYGFLKYEKP